MPNVFTNAFSVQTQSTQGAEVTTDAPATTDTTLTISTHSYIATLLGYLQQQQIASVYNINEIYARKAGGTLMENLEGLIFALWSSVTTNTIGDTASVITDSEIRQAIEKLATEDVPLDESAFFFHPYETMRLLRETVVEQFRKLRENLSHEAIRSQTQKWGGSETIIGTPLMVVG